MNHLIEPVLRSLSWWSEHSQRRACRNAMVASTALAATRQEREEVHTFVAAMIARRAPVPDAALTPPGAARLG